MRPRTVSASSIKSFLGCEKRYAAETSGRVSVNSAPGLFGTALHAALDKYIEKMTDSDGFVLPEAGGEHNPSLLMDLWTASCAVHVGWGSDYMEEGRTLLTKWLATRPLPPRVLSREVKKSFDIEVPGYGEKQPVTWILDRLDLHPDGTYEVIDYKSQWLDVNSTAMRKLVQPALYASAVRREYGAEQVAVTYDLLRYEPTTIYYTASQIDEFDAFLAAVVKRIWDLPAEDARETLNYDCRYCPRKAGCATLLNASEIGWTPTMSLEEIAALHDNLKGAAKGIESLLAEVDALLLEEVRKAEDGTVELDGYTLSARSKTTVKYDPEVVFRALGDEAVQYMTVSKTALDKELNRKKNPRYTPEEIDQIKDLAIVSRGEPYVTVVPKAPVDGE